MNVLFVCHRVPYPPIRGGKIRPFHIIRHLAESHSVTVASLAESRQEQVASAPLQDYCDRLLVEYLPRSQRYLRALSHVPTRSPSSMGYFFSRELARRIEDETQRRRYDLLFAHCSSVAPYVAELRSIPKVFDVGDMDSQKWLAYRDYKRFPERLIYAVEGAKLEAAERRLARQFDLTTCTTEREWRSLQSIAAPEASDWFPNGVDTKRFRPTSPDYDPDLICFIGRMDYYPNQQCMQHFCRDTWPLLKRRRPGLRLLIVGAEPDGKVRRLAELDGVHVTGTVDDVAEIVATAALSVAPLAIARGTQNKILESLAMGIPVVCSELAAGGVDCIAGEHLLTATEPSDYASAILGLLEDSEKRRRLSLAGRRRMETHHSWSGSMRRLDEILDHHFDTSPRQPTSVDT